MVIEKAASVASTTTPSSGGAPAADADAPEFEFDIDVWQTGGRGRGKPLSFDESCYALYWNHLPSLEDDTAQPPAISNDQAANDETKNAPRTVLRVDGYSVSDRMATYKYIIEHSLCNVPVDASPEERSQLGKRVWGDNLERHFLWGYAALLDWEDRSGRLTFGVKNGIFDGGYRSSSTIATESWWGYMNFCYSVCILLGALDAGVLDPSIERIQLVDEHSNHLVRTDPIIRKTIKEWSVFWKDAVTPFVEQTLALQTNINDGTKKSLPFDDPRHERLYDAMNEHEWAVHSSVFRWAVFDDKADASLPQRLLRELPLGERKFCIGFCKIVDLFAALNWRTDLTTTLENGPGFMPLGVLTDDQVVPGTAVSKVEDYRRKTVVEMHNLCDTSYETLQRMASVWKRVGRWGAVRRNIGSMIHGLSHGSMLVKTKELCRLAIYLCLPANAWETLLWVGLAAAATGLGVSRNGHRNKQS